jgi:nucleoside 2-deoxyribosyltransferase
MAEIQRRLPYQVFLSAPMSAFDQDAYENSRSQAIKVAEHLKSCHNLKNVFYAGGSIKSTSDFDESFDALEMDTKAIRESVLFIMIYPKKVVSSALVEAGYALALKKPCIFFVRDRDDLPYILKGAENSSLKSEDIPTIKICTFSEIDDIFSCLDSYIPLLLTTQ